MRKHVGIGALAVALLAAGCTDSGTYRDDGWSMIVAEDYTAARDHYLAVLSEKPADPWAHLNLGVAYEELAELDLARQHYELAVEHGRNAEIGEVAQDGNVADRETTVAKVAAGNLASLGT
ncbi:MAG: hypothetical protein OEN23_13525 [Paracoccaceae bacterium]|nr:hypothetical protein [Paracoccaceae bacterium]